MLLSFLLAVLSAPAGLAQAPPADEPVLFVPARRWALVIGASDYPYLGELSYAASDAKAFSGSLIDRFGFDPSTVSLLTDEAEDPSLRPTAGNMFLALRRLLADSRRQKTDLFVFYFAGHGIGDESGDYLLPLDAAVETVTDVGLHVADVIAELSSAGMSNVLFVVDGCRTGNENVFGRELWGLAEQSNLAVILSCEPGQQSYEDRRLGGGVFTHYLVEALEDPALVDPDSGALWASRVAAQVQKRARTWTSRGFDGAQVPQVWNDPTRDVLLGAELPAGSNELVSAFARGAAKLDVSDYLASAGRYAELLFEAERYAECAELLKAAEQIGELPAHLLYLFADSLQATSRYAEMRRVQRQLVDSYPDSFYALTIIAHDLSGETSAPARYRASKQLWDRFPIESPDLALLIAFNLCTGGPQDEARVVLAEMLPHFEVGSRARAYAEYMSLLIEGQIEPALLRLERAEDFAGGYPGNHRLRYERLGILQESGQWQAVRDLLDRCIADWPEEGVWRARRAFFRFERQDWEGALGDAEAALELPLEPWSLLQAARAAGLDFAAVAKAVAAQAAESPLSWEAQLAAAICSFDSPAATQAAIDAARRLAPKLGTWTVRVAAIRFERAAEAFTRGLIDGRALVDFQNETFDVLAERVSELEGDREGWQLLCDVGMARSRYVQLGMLIERQLGATIEAGELQSSLHGPISEALLGAGKLELFQRLRVRHGMSALAEIGLGWFEAAWLVCAERDDEAAQLVAELAPAPQNLLQTAWLVRACLAARAGAPATARELLAESGPLGEAGRLAQTLAGLTFEVLGEPERALELFGPTLAVGGTKFFAKAAAWRTLFRRELAPVERESLAFVAGRDGAGNPLAAELSFAASPGVEAFRGTVEFDLLGGRGDLSAPGATLLLTVRKGGKVNGTVEQPVTVSDDGTEGGGDIWSLKGTIDEFGNMTADLLGAGKPARVFGKLAPVDLYATSALLVEHGLTLYVLDEEARLSGWTALLKP